MEENLEAKLLKSMSLSHQHSMGDYKICREEDILDLEEISVNNEQEVYETFDIDKAWQAIQYLLCNDIYEGEPPMGYIVPIMAYNGIECELDFGAFYLTVQQTQEAYEYLQTLSDDKIRNMYAFKVMVEDEVYPILKDEGDFYEYLYTHLLALRDFYKKTVKKGHAVIFYVS